MCELCDVQENWAVSLDEIDDTDLDPDAEYACEWVADLEGDDAEGSEADDVDDLGEMCGKPATWAVFEKYVEEHYCSRHVAESQAELGEAGSNGNGNGHVHSEEEYEPDVEFIPIRSRSERCDFVEVGGGFAVRPCGRPATHAVMVVQQFYQCDEHTPEDEYPRMETVA
ncbi:MAG: hypothetical protein FJ319_05920 [SAR202 cluster bacterium]|nr:hypothetical protein [SAR202 cluster bacterium]